MSSERLKAVATGAATAEQARNPYEQLKRQLETSKAEFLPLLGTPGNVDRFIRVVLNAVLANPDLLAADRRTLIASCMKAAQDGLLPDGRDAVLNIYSTNVARRGDPPQWVKMVQYLPMVQGMVKKLYEAGDITYIDAAAVFQSDRFTYRRGDDPKIEHEPTADDKPGPIVAAYAVAKLKNGEIKREVMFKRDLDAVKNASKATSESSPWNKWADQMAIKSVLKRIVKQLPRAEAFERIEQADNEALGFTSYGASAADLSAREPSAAPPPAVTHDPAPTFDFSQPGSFDHGDPLPAEHSSAQQAPAQAPAPAPSRTKPAAKQATTPAFDEQAYAEKLRKCTDPDTLSLMADELRDIADEAVRTRLQDVYRARLAELEGS